MMDADDVTEWIEFALAGNGMRRTGPIVTAQVRPWATVLLVPTGAGKMWFKANGSGGWHEARLLSLLGKLTNGWTPTPLAVDDRRGWLLLPDAGVPLAQAWGTGLDAWLKVIERYAVLQRKLEPYVDDILASGVPAYRPAELPDLITWLLDEIGDDDVPHVDIDAVRCWADELGSAGIPATIQHDDLHDGNVFVASHGSVFIDWADASVAHPFASLVYPVAQAIEAGWPESDVAVLCTRYLSYWDDIASMDRLRRAATLAMRLAGVGRALVWRRAVSGAERSALKEYYARGPQRWLGRLMDGSWAMMAGSQP